MGQTKPAKARPCVVCGPSCLAFRRSNDDFVFKTSQFRIHAVLESARGDVLECIRRKGLKETLRAGDDKAIVSDETLRAFMGGLSEEQFKQLFGLDHQLLDEGGR